MEGDSSTSKKARLNIDCSLEERRLIRLLAAKEDKSISQYILGLARREMLKEGLLKSTEEFWNSIGNSNPETQQNSNAVLQQYTC
jgi:uncharacterized protein (DUF1778 family)